MKSVCGVLVLMFLSFSIFAQEKKERDFKISGAFRMNVITQHYENPTKATSTSMNMDTWFLQVDGQKAGLDLSFQYRFYPRIGSHFIHHGYVGKALTDNLYAKLGVFQVPFGIAENASHSWFLQGTYFVGLEEDYDMGGGLTYTHDNLTVDFAYFRQAEPEGPTVGQNFAFTNAGPGRFGFDLTTGRVFTEVDAEGREITYNESLRELNTFNLRLRYNLLPWCELGLSAQAGGVYNEYMDKSTLSTAYAAHLYLTPKNFSIKAEIAAFDYNAKGVKIMPDGSIESYDLEFIQMGAFGGNNLSVTQASLYQLAVGYDLPIDFHFFDRIQVYTDFSYFDKANPAYGDSYQVIPGVMFKKGGLYILADFAFAKNHFGFTDDAGVGFEKGRVYSNNPSDKDKFYYTDNSELVGKSLKLSEIPWNYRLNINIGYYF